METKETKICEICGTDLGVLYPTRDDEIFVCKNCDKKSKFFYKKHIELYENNEIYKKNFDSVKDYFGKEVTGC